MTFTSFSNDTKQDRKFSKNSKNGVPKNRLRQNIKKRSERARSNARKQATEDNYAFIPTDTIVVHKHRNDFRKQRVNYSLELFSDEEQNVHQFPQQYIYWWDCIGRFMMEEEDPEYYLHEATPPVQRPVVYWSSDDYDSQNDYNGPSRFAENDGWDIDDYQPVGCFGVSHEKREEDLPLFDQKKVQVSMIVPSAETIKKLDNASVLIAIEKCEHFNQREYEKVIRNELTSEFNKARTELEEEAFYLDRIERNIGLQNRRMVPDIHTEEFHVSGYTADWF